MKKKTHQKNKLPFKKKKKKRQAKKIKTPSITAIDTVLIFGTAPQKTWNRNPLSSPNNLHARELVWSEGGGGTSCGGLGWVDTLYVGLLHGGPPPPTSTALHAREGERETRQSGMPQNTQHAAPNTIHQAFTHTHTHTHNRTHTHTHTHTH